MPVSLIAYFVLTFSIMPASFLATMSSYAGAAGSWQDISFDHSCNRLVGLGDSSTKIFFFKHNAPMYYQIVLNNVRDVLAVGTVFSQ